MLELLQAECQYDHGDLDRYTSAYLRLDCTAPSNIKLRHRLTEDINVLQECKVVFHFIFNYL